LCNLLGTRQALSTTFHPCTDGTTERKHRTLQAVLRHFVGPNQDDWDKHLSAAEFAINNSTHDSRKQSPFYLNYGFHPRTPLSIDLPDSHNNNNKNPASRFWLAEIKHNLQRAHRALEAAQASMKARADKSRREVSFAVGDMVMLSTRNLKQPGCKKFAPRWTGPFRISALVGAPDRPAVAARLELPARWRIHPVFHVSLLKHFHSDGANRPAPPPLAYDEDGAPLWEVQTLLAERTCTVTGQQEFLIRWKGYGPHEDSWSRESDILDKSLITEFRARTHIT
jgi:hypothetical protein